MGDGTWYLLGNWLPHQLSVTLREDPGNPVHLITNGDRQLHLLRPDRGGLWAKAGVGVGRETERERVVYMCCVFSCMLFAGETCPGV